MFAVLPALMSVVVLQNPTPAMAFSQCENAGNMDVALYPETEHSYVVHFHLKISNMKGKTAYARLDCRETKSRELTHTSLKVVKVETNAEFWAFSLHAPKIPEANDAVYELEVGSYDPADEKDLNEYRLMAIFIWQFKDGKMFTGTDKSPLQTIRTRRAIVAKGGSFVIVSEQMTAEGQRDLRFGIVKEKNKFPDLKDGSETAMRLPDKSKVKDLPKPKEKE